MQARCCCAHWEREAQGSPCCGREIKSAWWILLVGMTRFHGRWPNAGSKDGGMHAWSVCTFSRGLAACGGGGIWLAVRVRRLRRCNSQGEILRLAVSRRTHCAGTLMERIKWVCGNKRNEQWINNDLSQVQSWVAQGIPPFQKCYTVRFLLLWLFSVKSRNGRHATVMQQWNNSLHFNAS